MKKPTVSERMAVAEKRLGKTTSGKTDKKPAPKPKVKVRPTGGLKPSGAKASVTWKF